MKKKVIIILSIILFLILTVILYARFVGIKGLKVKEYKIEANITTEFDGLKIVHFSDLHYGSTINKNELINLVNKINFIKPDLVFFTGDLVDNVNENNKNELVEYLSKINIKINKYAVSGNHDTKEYDEIMTSSGFIVLNNEYDLIYNEGLTPILIAGITSNLLDTTNIDEKMDKIYKYIEENEIQYKILLLHEPDYTDNVKNFNLYLSGHSHNRQINLPIISDIIKINGAKNYYKEHYSLDNKELFISGGLGTSHLKLRLFSRPSINFYRLVSYQ